MGFLPQWFLWLRSAGSRHLGVVTAVEACGLQVLGLQQLQPGGSLVAAHRPHGARASAVAAGGLSRCGTWAYLLHGTWNFSRPGTKSRVPSIDSQLLIHCATGEALLCSTFKSSCLLLSCKYSLCTHNATLLLGMFCKYFLPVCGFSFSLPCFLAHKYF